MDGNIDATAASVPAAAAQATTTTPCSGGHHHPVADDTAPISRIVAQVAAQCPGERISLGEMAEAFGDRAGLSSHRTAHELPVMRRLRRLLALGPRGWRDLLAAQGALLRAAWRLRRGIPRQAAACAHWWR